jgi:hypothetical protein
MEQATQASDNGKSALEAQLRENYGKTVYSHKVQEKCADDYSEKLRRIKLLQIILSAMTAGTLIATFFGDNKAGTIIAVVLSTSLLALNTYTKDYDLGELAQKHVETATRIWSIRESYLSLLTDLSDGNINLEEAITKRDELQELLASVYLNAPRTNSKAYAAAQKALKINEELTFSDEEIDKFLPAPLRRTR